MSIKKWYLTVILIFTIFLVGLPELNRFFVKCLKNSLIDSFNYFECNVGIVLNNYLVLSLVGFSIAILALFYLMKIKNRKNFKNLIILAVSFTIMIIVSFYNYIPFAERQLSRVSIILDKDSFNMVE